MNRTVGRIAATALALGGLTAVALAPTAAMAASPTAASDVSTVKNAKLGTILVSGNTVYTLKASKTRCTAACLKAWPPVLLAQGVTKPTAGSGVNASKLATVATADGGLQVTYAGKPLYFFSKDTAPGQVHGNVSNKWGKWSAVVIAKSGSGATETTTPGTGGNAF